MGVPATTGILRTNIKDMKIGDYITTYFRTNPTLSFSITPYSDSVGEMPLGGVKYGDSNQNNTYLYFIKVAKGLLVADRVTQHSISWDKLNSDGGYIEGVPYTISDIQGTIRSLTGGCAYADENGNMSLTDKGFGAFPNTNEWDKYILNFPKGKIQAGKTLNDVFHYKDVLSWMQETPVMGLNLNGTSSNATRALRPSAIGGEANTFNYIQSSASNNIGIGFRPVFEYDESKL